MPQVPDPKELLFDGLHAGIRQGVENGFLNLTSPTGQSQPEAITLFQQQLEIYLATYLAACEVVNQLVIPVTAKGGSDAEQKRETG